MREGRGYKLGGKEGNAVLSVLQCGVKSLFLRFPRGLFLDIGLHQALKSGIQLLEGQLFGVEFVTKRG